MPVAVFFSWKHGTLLLTRHRVHEGVLEELLCTTSTTSVKDVDPQSLAPELLRYMRCTWSPVR